MTTPRRGNPDVSFRMTSLPMNPGKVLEALWQSNGDSS